MRPIDADAFDTVLKNSEIEANKQRKYVLASALNTIRGNLRNFPSAQPETFGWCHDCKEYDQEQHCCHRWSQQIRKTIEELEANYPQEAKDELQYWKERAAQLERDYYIRAKEGKPERNKGEWIPCSERLPENGHYYLWCSDMGHVQSDYYWDGFENGMKYGYNIVAWMPLPEPYGGES